MRIGIAVESIRPAAEAAALAARIESLGFDSIWTPDHIAYTQPILDPFAMLAIYASSTSRITVGTCVYLLPLRAPALVAKQTASVDWLSNGRLIFGVGVGGEFPHEYEAAHVPMNERGARANAAIPALRALWKGEAPPASTRFPQVPAIQLNPLPKQPEGPPIWIGGRSEAALKRAADLGDGYLGYFLDGKGFRDRMDQIHQRRGSKITGAMQAFARVDETREAAIDRAAQRLRSMYGQDTAAVAGRYGVLGTADDCRERIRSLAESGVDHLIFSIFATPEELDGQLEQLAEVIPRDRP